MKDKILIVNEDSPISETIGKWLAEQSFKTIVAESKQPVIINGISYYRKDVKFSKLDMLQSIIGYREKTPDMPAFNLVDEFTLIQNKQSNLTRSQREYVVYKFNQTYGT